MAVTIKQTESPPETYPPVGGTSFLAEGTGSAVWQRIEAYIAYRYTPRTVVWLVEGEGHWTAPLAPALLDRVEVWEHGDWSDCTPGASPWGGYELPGDGPYRITATVGEGAEVPALVSEAVGRLARYVAAIQRTPGERFAMRRTQTHLHSSGGEGGGTIGSGWQTFEQERQRLEPFDGSAELVVNWPAKALQLSGAADLLRNYRKV